MSAHAATRFWGTATVLALQLVARGRVLPWVTEEDNDAWRIGQLSQDDFTRLRQLTDAMPAEARATPNDSGDLPSPEPLLRGFLDAVADGLPRTEAAGFAIGRPEFSGGVGLPPRKLARLKPWAEENAAGLDAGLRISLRVEVTGGDLDRGRFQVVVQVHSLGDSALVADAARVWADPDHPFGSRAHIDVMLAVRRAARAWSPLESLLNAAVPDELALGDDEVVDLLGSGATRLSAAGVDVHWPKDFVRDLTAHAVVGEAKRQPSDVAGFFARGRSLKFNWRLALGGTPLTSEEMDRLAESHRPVVRLRDQWVLVDPALAAKARDRALKSLKPMDALSAALTGTAEVDGEVVQVAASGWLEELRDRIAQPGEELCEQPPELAATLRDYQLRGLRWLARMTSLGLGGCLADDMGLGKTITVIALHLHRKAGAPTLVVCPASLLGNWEREIERFAPGTPVRRFHGGNRTLDGADSGFVLTTYGTMRLDAELLAEHSWDLLVADEAQHVKNHNSGTAKALRSIPAAARVALTGTPVENNLAELWSVLDWTTPGLLGGLTAFRSRWAKPIEAERDQATADRFAQLIRPFLLRRRKSDPGIAPELPPKTETDHPVSLTTEQAALYEAVVRETMAEIAATDGMTRRGLIIKLLTSLKQICNHPAHFLAEDGSRLPGRSGKLELLDELLETILAEDGAVLVFTQYVAMARLLQAHLGARGVSAQLLHGGTPVAAREELVQRFQEGKSPVFLLSLKAAGTGLNLTRADHVVHYDRWWNPAVEEQATDRAYRIGQTRPVQVHRFVTEGTIEDRIAEMLRDKRDLADKVLADKVLGGGEAGLTELGDAELANLVELRSPR
ncbi:DEAD/DEAH box helicase [Allokutzneria sp. A3M-2-11 16]|uniref:DEAD/DEAH box helicase n=1 Tax=Allokutzneria sp. A3M-2-11 16 TaxID=2962043 RepID=UPI0020B8EF72|nr:DEAD/DEAH box helicase [Allokutzneria sp. A3M-2-11 16]MCP3802968.1 DEAD/DEAH box helicase [Allokutzneria sp. A3M-2-11 16]